MSEQTIFSAISHVTGDAVIVPSRKGPQAVVPAESLIDVLSTLRDEQNFDSLCDITCIDYLDYEATEDGWAPPGRFGLSYMLANTKNNEQLTIRVFVGPPDPTAISIADSFPALIGWSAKSAISSALSFLSDKKKRNRNPRNRSTSKGNIGSRSNFARPDKAQPFRFLLHLTAALISRLRNNLRDWREQYRPILAIFCLCGQENRTGHDICVPPIVQASLLLRNIPRIFLRISILSSLNPSRNFIFESQFFQWSQGFIRGG